VRASAPIAIVSGVFALLATVTLAAAPAADLPTLSDQARTVLRTHCGECHVSNLPGANAAAVAIFDLAAPDWSARLDARKLREAEHRLQGKKPPPADRELFHTFVVKQSAQVPKQSAQAPTR
jgi:mono/diheme cytochrome c family protein